MCIDCLNQLQNWEEFRQKCMTANACIQEYLQQMEEKEQHMSVNEPKKTEDQIELDKQDDNNYENTFNCESNNQDSDNDLPMTSISITVMSNYLKLIFHIFHEYVIFRLKKHTQKFLKQGLLKLQTKKNIMSVECVL